MRIYFHYVLAEKISLLNIHFFNPLPKWYYIDINGKSEIEIYLLSKLLLESCIPFVLICNDYSCTYRFGIEHSISKFFRNIYSLELSNEEIKNINYYKIMSSI